MKSFFALLIGIGINVSVFAQADQGAKAILDKASKNFRSWKTVQATVGIQIENAANKTTSLQTAKVELKASKFKVDIEDQIIVSDGVTIWTIYKDGTEVQISNAKEALGDINPANVFVLYEKGFAYKLVGAVKEENRAANLIELTPNDKTKNYFKIKLYVDSNTGNVFKATTFQKSGVKTSYVIQKLKTNQIIDDATMAFDKKKYPKAEIVDLR